MGKADDAADDQGAVSSLPTQNLTYETGFVEDLESRPFLLARWLDTG